MCNHEMCVDSITPLNTRIVCETDMKFIDFILQLMFPVWEISSFILGTRYISAPRFCAVYIPESASACTLSHSSLNIQKLPISYLCGLFRLLETVNRMNLHSIYAFLISRFS